jgi:hypothetical protein
VSTRVFLGNLSFNIDEEILGNVFKECGTITDLEMVKNHTNSTNPSDTAKPTCSTKSASPASPTSPANPTSPPNPANPTHPANPTLILRSTTRRRASSTALRSARSTAPRPLPRLWRRTDSRCSGGR